MAVVALVARTGGSFRGFVRGKAADKGTENTDADARLGGAKCLVGRVLDLFERAVWAVTIAVGGG